MKEKQFDHIENKIREAAENSEPDFDEQSWQKMEQLLDKENDRKRPLAWFIVPALLCALVAGYFIFNKKNVPVKEITIAAEKLSSAQKTTKDIGEAEKHQPLKNTAVVIPKENTLVTITSNVGQPDMQHNNVTSTLTDAIKKTKNKNQSLEDEINSSSHGKRTLKGKTKMMISPAVSSEEDESNVHVIEDIGKTTTVSADTLPTVSSDTMVVTKKKILPADTAVKNTIADKTPDRKKARVSSRFYFIASAGAEVSSVKFLSTAGSATAGKYGLGVGYQLTKKLAVQTGFNVSRKKYIAGAGDYNPKVGSYWAMVQIKKVDANCLVYDIPLTLRYDILQKQKFSLYATAGVSSFIMKKEEYQYDYIRDNIFYQRGWTYTGNKNLFSVVSVSAGIETKIGNGFSLLAEPSVSVPVSGVGDGKVKLYSMGLQVGLKYQPFKKVKR